MTVIVNKTEDVFAWLHIHNNELSPTYKSN